MRSVFEELIKDIQARNEKGRETYGVEMNPFDGRNSLRDAYEEILDCAAYLKKCLMETEEEEVLEEIKRWIETRRKRETRRKK